MQYVRQGGFYTIEDWGAGYFPTSQDGHPDGRHGLARLVKELLDEVAVPDRTMQWKGERSLDVDRDYAAPIDKAVITNGVAAFFRGEGEWMPQLGSGSRIDARVIDRDVRSLAKTIARRILR
jgi:hypothetical protein